MSEIHQSQWNAFPYDVICLTDLGERAMAMVRYLDKARAHIVPKQREELASTALETATDGCNSVAQGRALMHMANSWSDRANYNNAIHLHLRAQEVLDRTDDLLMQASVRNDLATVHYRLGRHDDAMSYLEMAIKLSARANDPVREATFSMNLAIMELSVHNDLLLPGTEMFERVHTLLEDAAAVFRSLMVEEPANPHYPLYLAGTLHAMGQLFEHDRNSALIHYRECLKVLESNNLNGKSGLYRTNLAGLLAQMGEVESAEQQFALAEQLAIAAGDFNLLPTVLEKASIFYEANGQLAKALGSQKRLNEANSRIKEINTKDQLDKLKAHFEAEQKAKDAEIYQLRYVELEAAKQKSDELLLNILPAQIADELKAKGQAEARLLENVTVLFTDFKGFTQLSEQLSPKELVNDLNDCFTAFDHICEKHGIEKIKTIGDAYMAAGGLPTPCADHAQRVVRAALEMREFIDNRVTSDQRPVTSENSGEAKGDNERQSEQRTANGEQPSGSSLVAGHSSLQIRIGIHTGPVVAGIVGVKKFQYDIWGDTVNTASRMESSGEVGKVNISEATYSLIKDDFSCEYRGEIEAKGKGRMGMWFVSNEKQ